MDLVDAAVNFQQTATMSRVQYAIARKLLDTQQFQGQAAVKLIQAAGDISDQAGDQLVAAATGLGRQLDVTG